MAVLFVALLWMLRTCAYRYRWLFGGTVSLFLLVLGSTVTQIQWDKMNSDWSSEKKVYRGVVQETPVEKEKVMVCKVKTEDRQVLLSVYKDSLSQTLQSGDNILFYGKIRSPHNAGNPYEFDYASYLLRKQIGGTAYVYAGYWRVMDKQRVLGIKQQAMAEEEKKIVSEREEEQTQLQSQQQPTIPDMSPNDRKFMDKLVELMEQNMDNGDLVVDDLVRELAVSRSVFFKKLKTLTGLAPIEFIKEIRIKRATQLIETGEFNMTQISYMVGINDPRYFSKCFKAQVGMTPTEYKEKIGR